MTSNLLFILRRRWPILVILPILTVIAVYVLSPPPAKTVPRYKATVFVAGDPQVVGNIALEQVAVDMVQSDVARAAAKKLGEQPADLEKFASQLQAKVDPESLTVKLSTEDTDRARARPYVRAFAEAFIAQKDLELQQEFNDQLAIAQEDRDEVQKELQEFSIANAVPLSQVPPEPTAAIQKQALETRLAAAEKRVTDIQATDVDSPYRISGQSRVTLVATDKLKLPASRSVRAGLAFLLSIVGAIAVIAVIERLNPRVDSPADAEAIVGAPVLAMVPILSGKRRRVLERADLSLFTGPFAESFRGMRSHLDFRASTEGLDRPPCVMIVSSAPAEGKSTSTAFLALSYSEAGRDVVVVGADFRRPSIHRLFGVKSKPGLSTRMLSDAPPERPEEAVRSIVKRDPRTGVRVIPSGPATDRVTGLLGDLSAVTSAALDSGFTVVIDTAPIVVANDAIDFLPLVDWVIVVVRVGKTAVRSLRQTITSLELNEAKIAGCVMVGSLESSDAKRYYYSYYRVEEETLIDGANGAKAGQPKATPPSGEPEAEPPAEPTADAEATTTTPAGAE